MQRLTFEVAASPFLATSILRKLADDYKDTYPDAYQLIMDDFYVDDLITGTDSLERATFLRAQLNYLLSKAGMLLRKWRSSSSAILDTIPESLKESEPLQIGSDPSKAHKTLGIHWDAGKDVLYVSIPVLQVPKQPTKRDLASSIVRLFDVLRWFPPATILVKILLQRAWCLQQGWDDPLPPDISTPWKDWCLELPHLQLQGQKRCIFQPGKDVRVIELHSY